MTGFRGSAPHLSIITTSVLSPPAFLFPACQRWTYKRLLSIDIEFILHSTGGRPPRFQRGSGGAGASVIDILANSKIRFDSVKRMTQIQNTSLSFAETKYFSVAARQHTLAPPAKHRPRHSQMSLTARQNTPAIDAAIYCPDGTLY